MKPHFFKTPADFREWLNKNYNSEIELLVGFYKKASGKESLTWPESVDEALCFGWIDGVRRSFTEDSYTIRFTPRRPGSIWSAVNIDKMNVLISKGLVKPEGLEAFEKRTESKSRIYAFEQKEDPVLPEVFERQFRENEAAYGFFINQAPSYKKVVLHWIITAKQDKTKQSRFDKLVQACEEGRRL